MSSAHFGRRIALGSILVVAACSADLELPVPPSVEAEERAYDNPTLELSSATAQAVLDEFFRQLQQLDDVGRLQPVVDAVVEFEREVEPAGDGRGVEIRGVPIKTDAVVALLADCPGHVDGSPVVNAVRLEIVIRESALVPVAWGPVDDCRLAIERDDRQVPVVFSGEIIAYVPSLLDPDSDRTVIFVAYSLSELELDGRSLPAVSSDFRLVDEVLELRIDVLDDHLVGFGGGSGVVGIRAANGLWQCFPEERRCERQQSPADSFSY